jgi:hypothetical protein
MDGLSDATAVANAAENLPAQARGEAATHAQGDGPRMATAEVEIVTQLEQFKNWSEWANQMLRALGSQGETLSAGAILNGAQIGLLVEMLAERGLIDGAEFDRRAKRLSEQIRQQQIAVRAEIEGGAVSAVDGCPAVPTDPIDPAPLSPPAPSTPPAVAGEARAGSAAE